MPPHGKMFRISVKCTIQIVIDLNNPSFVVMKNNTKMANLNGFVNLRQANKNELNLYY